jgi:hypothetical protein
MMVPLPIKTSTGVKIFANVSVSEVKPENYEYAKKPFATPILLKDRNVPAVSHSLHAVVRWFFF